MDDTQKLDSPVALNAILAETAALDFAMASEPRTGSLLRTLARSKPDAHILELGTGTGVATAWLLDGMDAQSRLISVEQDRAVASVATRHLGEDPRATFYVEDAEEVLARIADLRFDLIFADTWVGKFNHLDDALGLLKEGGLYVIDDMLPQANWPDGHAEKVHDLISILETRGDVVLTKLSWASGIIVAAKRRLTNGRGV